MNLHNRFLSFMVIDSLIVFTTAYLCSYFLYFDSGVFTAPLLILSVTLITSHHLFAYLYKLYKRAWEYASVNEIVIITKAVTFSVVVAAFIQFIILNDVYLRVLISTWMMQMLLIGGFRFSWRLFRDKHMLTKHAAKKRTLIIGAGSAGNLVARQLKQSKDCELYPVAFVDDDKRKHHLEVLSIPVIGGLDNLPEKVERLGIENIIIAIPSLNKKELNRIYLECKKTNAKTQTIPMFEDLVTGKVTVNEIRTVEVGELLGREQIELDTESIAEYITDSIVLVTGAGGSIGSEICRQISQFKPSKLILLGHGENSIYSIEMELKNTYNNIEYVTEIADIQDQGKMLNIMKQHRPRTVFHAAAHKHVPLMERNPEEAVKNNVLGTKNVADAADVYKVETFVMISSDKAVNPTSVMGATKRMAEMIVQDMDKRSQTRFVAVRFGNVLGSRGSVIPLFTEQIKNGGPITITHPDMKRYFMTIPEASRLVLQAGALARGGEVFVLDMGEPVKILDLAKNLIRLSGFQEEEIEIKFTGVRAGEKLFEELLGDNEVHEDQIYPKIYVGKSVEIDMETLENLLKTYWSLEKEEMRGQVLAIANTNKIVHEHELLVI
ncbi:polysaccharide biosynthesis protein [Metabacillus idriensis]|uniref:NAD-dependent epimerase/dehydratase family protein n=1 Tax=Metabacillus idriensis TaxID=324768 RepID=A0A6I2MDF8_9BACI|nr:nucleoside-diphosphate sugar epimerase/dehydratase [Metabacillus idriensis]MCM3598332.1 polysaccharide biosynthesis protein [Metabacillus idriensis]MRX55046.1 NAD-dependent epimerase/dehydratase family protein [Metabacillus idriensis]OHR71606.1 hypothetical protein HMPREF3291_23955 [Bacillus sp. HMSC76G11]